MLVRRRDVGLDAIQAAKPECRIRTNLAIALICPRAAFGSRTAVSRIPLSETLSPNVTKLRRDISQTADFPEDRYVVSGVMPGGYAYCSPSTPTPGFVEQLGRPA